MQACVSDRQGTEFLLVVDCYDKVIAWCHKCFKSVVRSVSESENKKTTTKKTDENSPVEIFIVTVFLLCNSAVHQIQVRTRLLYFHRPDITCTGVKNTSSTSPVLTCRIPAIQASAFRLQGYASTAESREVKRGNAGDPQLEWVYQVLRVSKENPINPFLCLLQT